MPNTTVEAVKTDALVSLFRGLAQTGMGPGGTPHGEIRQVMSQLAGELTAPLFATGSIASFADAAANQEVKLWFKPKVIIAYLEAAVSTQNMLFVKFAGMGTGASTDFTCARLALTVAPAAGIGNYLKLEGDGSNLQAFTLHADAIGATTDKIHWIALG